jgi:hypothetical protein
LVVVVVVVVDVVDVVAVVDVVVVVVVVVVDVVVVVEVLLLFLARSASLASSLPFATRAHSSSRIPMANQDSKRGVIFPILVLNAAKYPIFRSLRKG